MICWIRIIATREWVPLSAYWLGHACRLVSLIENLLNCRLIVPAHLTAFVLPSSIEQLGTRGIEGIEIFGGDYCYHCALTIASLLAALGTRLVGAMHRTVRL